ncbi:MAG: nucleoside phosphorylase [Firmicutes bacterium]|nr:nucleoside phosphorylase [Bacillota bacterium]
MEVKQEKVKREKVKKELYPILEFDPISKPIVEPKNYEAFFEKRRGVKRCVFTYFTDVIDDLERTLKVNQVFRIRTEGYRPRVYEMKVGNEYIYVLPMPLGAPQAARMLEILSAQGIKKFMVCGGAGTLNDAKTKDYVLVPTVAVRDEGTSYHYLPPKRDVKMNPSVIRKIIQTLIDEGVDYAKVKTWTTDASFRETVDIVEMRKKEGCDVVEMECSAFLAVAEHKKLLCGQLLYAADVVCKTGWDYRDWHTRTDQRLKLFDLAVKCVMKL